MRSADKSNLLHFSFQHALKRGEYELYEEAAVDTSEIHLFPILIYLLYAFSS